MKRITICLTVALAICAGGCTTSSNEGLEGARFALDRGDWSTAISSAGAVLSSDPSDIEAALLLSAAYAGRAGVRILTVSADIAKAENSDSEFDVVHDALVDTISDLADLRRAIEVLSTTLTPQPDSSNELYVDQQFQLGMLEAIEVFGLPSLTAQPTADGAIASADITSDIRSNVQSDFVGADDHLINSGMEESDDLIKNLRKTYCVLKNASAGGSGFDTAALQDLNLCQLTPEADRGGLADFQSPTITSCSDFDFSACEGAGNTAL